MPKIPVRIRWMHVSECTHHDVSEECARALDWTVPCMQCCLNAKNDGYICTNNFTRTLDLKLKCIF